MFATTKGVCVSVCTEEWRAGIRLAIHLAVDVQLGSHAIECSSDVNPIVKGQHSIANHFSNDGRVLLDHEGGRWASTVPRDCNFNGIGIDVATQEQQFDAILIGVGQLDPHGNAKRAAQVGALGERAEGMNKRQ